MWGLAAFSRSDFVHILGRQHRHYQAGPVSDGVAEECSPMGAGIPARIEHDPDQQNDAGDDAQGMAMKECAFAVGHPGSMIVARNG